MGEGSKSQTCAGEKCKTSRMKLTSKTDHSENHQCYMQLLLPVSHSDTIKLWGFETSHHVLLLVCTKLWEGVKWHVWGVNCAHKVTLHFRRALYKNVGFIAHNAGGVGTHLLFNVMLEQDLKHSLIMQDSEVTSVDQNILTRCLFSACAYLLCLKRFTYQLKGYFPPSFQLRINKLRGCLPIRAGIRCTANDSVGTGMAPWLGWVSVSGHFWFREETLRYRESFRKKCIAETEVDHCSCVTIATACKRFSPTFHPVTL